VRTVKRLWIAFAVCLALALFCVFLTIGAIVAASDDLTAGQRRDDAIGAIVVGAIAAILIIGAVHFEHRARRRGAPGQTAASGGALLVQPAPESGAAETIVAKPRRRPARRDTRRHQEVKNSPAGLGIALVVMTALTILFAWGSVHVYHDNQRFLDTKADGIPMTATITGNTVHTHSSRGGKTYTTTISLRLDQPVDGVADESISLSGRHADVDHQPGADVDVLVNPNDPHYAILTDQTTSDGVTWIVLLCFAVATGVLDALAVLGLLRLKRRQSAAKREHGSTAPTTL
jgi:hypothetical protein